MIKDQNTKITTFLVMVRGSLNLIVCTKRLMCLKNAKKKKRLLTVLIKVKRSFCCWQQILDKQLTSNREYWTFFWSNFLQTNRNLWSWEVFFTDLLTCKARYKGLQCCYQEKVKGKAYKVCFCLIFCAWCNWQWWRDSEDVRF